MHRELFFFPFKLKKLRDGLKGIFDAMCKRQTRLRLLFYVLKCFWTPLPSVTSPVSYRNPDLNARILKSRPQLPNELEEEEGKEEDVNAEEGIQCGSLPCQHDHTIHSITYH